MKAKFLLTILAIATMSGCSSDIVRYYHICYASPESILYSGR